jgi:hypothetical protein
MRFILLPLAALALLLAACTPPPTANPVGDFAPVTDTTIPGGDVTIDSMTIPTGVTVTMEQGSTFEVAGDVEVSGTLVVDCEGLELNIAGDLTVSGGIDNTCDGGGTPGALLMVVDGGLTLDTDSDLTSDGDIDITDSATQNEPLDPLALVGDLQPRGHAGALQPAQGAAWEINAAPVPGRSGRVRVTRNGDINVNVDIDGGDGADGADQNVAGMCDASGEKGKKGGTVSLAARNGTLTLGAGVTVTGGDGGAGGSCTAPSGCPATAIGGDGGRGGSVLVGGNNVIFGAGVTLVRGSGGPGGNATAVADDGVGCLAAGCEATATGGKGGPAGGIGYVILEPGVVQGNPSEDGGNGGRGGDASATAGDGGHCDDCTIGDGGVGGNASANAGRGGDGATGNIWPVAANSHKKGDGGDATAFAGTGGDGADCCKFGEGGDGGAGGDANSVGGAPGAKGMNGGADGAANGSGGDGGDGGDGATPGVGGAAGSGSGNPTDISDGVDGLPGEVCQFEVWWVYYSSIPDGVIAPGTTLTLDTYDNPVADPGNITDQVDSTFLDPQALTALGFPTQSGQMYPNYQKSGAQVQIGADPAVGFAGFDIDLSGLTGFPVDGLELNLFPINGSSGLVILLGHGANGDVIQTTEVPVAAFSEFATVMLPPPPPESGESVYTRITVITDFYFFFDHWGVVIIDP